MEPLTAFFERPEPHILASQHEQVEDVYDGGRWHFNALEQVERGLASFVKRDDSSIYHGVVRQLADRFDHAGKAADEVSLVA
jgi:hypothetical protein